MDLTIPAIALFTAIAFVLITKYGQRVWMAIIFVMYGFFLAENQTVHDFIVNTITGAPGFIGSLLAP